ncbi:unnamed protein product, partial [Auanema sp. JU1783]
YRVKAPDAKYTKRGISQAIASIYDPMGWVCPLLLPLRLFLQRLWDEMLEWDTPLPDKLAYEWENLAKQINLSKNIPRAIRPSPNNEYLLVTCTDSSSTSVGIAIYIVPENQSSATLLFAKSKLHSRSTSITIPKAEFSALSKGVTNTLNTLRELKSSVSIKQVIFLSDSEIALAWIKTKPERKTTGTFVHNRIKQILTESDLIREQGATPYFGYINTKDNPADIATRGATG